MFFASIIRGHPINYNHYSMRTQHLLIFFAACFLLISSVLRAQTVRGVISSGSNEPLPGAIAVADDSIAATADGNGRYTLKLSPGKHSLQFRMISFLPETREVTIKENDEIELNVSLKSNEHQLGIVVITASKFEQKLEDVTVSMEVLKPQIIESRNNVAIDEAVDYIPGVLIIDGQANIRGGSGWSYGAGSRVQVMVDDLPMLTADAGDSKWNFLPVENLEQIEVIKGASSVLFGSSALNGVMNIRTGFPRDTPMTKISMFGGMYDNAYITTDKKYSVSYQDENTFYGGLSFFHSRKINRLDLVVGGNYFNDQSYRQDENEKRGRINFNTRYNFKLKGLSAGINFNTMVNNANIFFLWKNDTTGAYKPAENTISKSTTYRTNVDPFITYINDRGSVHKLRTRWFGTNNVNNTDQNSRGDLYYYEYQYQKRFGENITLTTGLVNIENVVKSELYSDHNGNQKAGYLQGDFKWKRFNFSGGVRAERNEVDSLIDNWKPVFRAGVNYHAFGGTYFRASAGQGYRFPSIAERFIQTTVGGANIFPNPELKPENGQSYEIGVKQLVKIGSLIGYIDFAAFQNDYQNMMEFAFAQWGTSGTLFSDFGFKSVNVGDTRIKGFEITMMAETKISSAWTLTLQAGYTYLNPRQLTFDSAYVAKIGEANIYGSDSTTFLKYRSRHMIKGDLALKSRKIELGFSIRYTSRMENIDRIFTVQPNLLDFLFPPGLGIADYRNYHKDGDIIVDGRVSYNFTGGIQLSFIIKNLGNHIYMQRPGDMQPPRVFALQGVVKF